MPALPWLKIAEYAAIIAALGVVYFWIYSQGEAHVQAQWDAEKAATALRISEIKDENAAKERGWANDLRTAQDALDASKAATQAALDAALADVHSGAVKLRKPFSGCRSVSGDTQAPGRNAEAGETGLSEADQAVALRIGAAADNVVAILTQCQAYVRSVAQ